VWSGGPRTPGSGARWHIVTLFSVEEDRGVHFLTLELSRSG
jgi:hypothetical protein